MLTVTISGRTGGDVDMRGHHDDRETGEACRRLGVPLSVTLTTMVLVDALLGESNG